MVVVVMVFLFFSFFSLFLMVVRWCVTTIVAPALVSLHVAPYTECLATARVGALEWLLPRVRVAVDS